MLCKSNGGSIPGQIDTRHMTPKMEHTPPGANLQAHVLVEGESVRAVQGTSHKRRERNACSSTRRTYGKVSSRKYLFERKLVFPNTPPFSAHVCFPHHFILVLLEETRSSGK